MTWKKPTPSLAGLVFLTLTTAASAGSSQWPMFRGPNACGIADGNSPPTTWDVEQGTNVKWKTPVPGLGHSSPVIWGQRVFLTSAVPEGGREVYLRAGLYGDSPDNPEEYVHDFKVHCLDAGSGRTRWSQTAHSGIPRIQRHVKSSHANSTPATDGRHLVVFFGSEGLYCYDLDGKLLWNKDLGLLDSGAFDAKEIQWGFGSSPIIFEKMVIVQCDVNNQSFVAAFDVETGREIWRAEREEVPTWSTPSVYRTRSAAQIVCNGWKHIGGYDAHTGRELWRMRGGGDIPVPTPVIAHDMAFITNAHGGLMPIYAIRLDARGDVSLTDGQTSNDHVVWSRPRHGAYMPTPIVCGDHLYLCNDRGILTCYHATTGEQVYRTRVADKRGTYTASPVAADGKIYFTSEEGDIHVIRAGTEFEHLATNSMNAVCLATPAIADGMLFIRTSTDLYCIAQTLAAEPGTTPREPGGGK